MTGRQARWFAVGIGAAVLVATWAGSFLVPVCRDVLAATGDAGVVRICGPLSTGDLTVPALLFALLLLPDVTRIAVPGLIELERKVDEVKEAVEVGRERIVGVAEAQEELKEEVRRIVPRWLSEDRMVAENRVVIAGGMLENQTAEGRHDPVVSVPLIRRVRALKEHPENLSDEQVHELFHEIDPLIRPVLEQRPPAPPPAQEPPRRG